MPADLNRRLLLGGLLAAPALLGGCKVFDRLPPDGATRNLFESANRLTYETQQRVAGDLLGIERRQRMAEPVASARAASWPPGRPASDRSLRSWPPS